MITLDQIQLKRLEHKIWFLSSFASPKQIKKILRKAAKPLIKSARSKAPESKEEHHRYKDGRIVATYVPGNLSRSIKTLTFRKLKQHIVIGPKVDKNRSGKYSGRRTDALYAPSIEFGSDQSKAQPFLEPAWEEAKLQVMALIVSGLRRNLLRAAK